MDVKKRDVCMIAGFCIQEYQIIESGEVIDTFFKIKDGEGEIHSKNFDNMLEPYALLLELEETAAATPTQK